MWWIFLYALYYQDEEKIIRSRFLACTTVFRKKTNWYGRIFSVRYFLYLAKKMQLSESYKTYAKLIRDEVTSYERLISAYGWDSWSISFGTIVWPFCLKKSVCRLIRLFLKEFEEWQVQNRFQKVNSPIPILKIWSWRKQNVIKSVLSKDLLEKNLEGTAIDVDHVDLF